MGNACTSETSVQSGPEPAPRPADSEEAGGAPEDGLDSELALEKRLRAVDADAAAKKKKFEEERAAAEAAMKTTAGAGGQLTLGVSTDMTVEEFMAVKPWLGAIVEPTGWTKPADLDSAPPNTLSLDWVYGYGGDSTRDNLFFSDKGELVYHVAAIGVVENYHAHSQRWYAGKTGHTDDITCLAVSPDRKVCATGQLGKSPYINVWDLETMELLARLKNGHQRAIVTVAFSGDGNLICSTGLENERSLVVWDWKQEKQVASCNMGADQIFACKFNPTNNNTIVAVGVKCFKLFTLSGSALSMRKGVFGPKGTMQTLLSLDFAADGTAITGGFSGEVYKWTGNTVSQAFKAHTGGVLAVRATPDGQLLTGGNDGKVCLWSAEGKNVWTVEPKLGGVRALDIRGDQVAIGTARSEIAVINSTSHAVQNVVTAHWLDETWALAVHPSKTAFVSGGDEGTVRLWDGVAHKQVAVAQAGSGVRSLAWNGAAHTIAAGTMKGDVVLYSADDLKEIKRTNISKTSIDELKFSPDGKKLACGSHDSVVVVLSADNLSKLGTLTGHHEAVWHFDWSQDNQYLQTNSRGYELLFWDMNTYKQITSATAMRDVQWATWTCTLGWPVQGIWPKYADGTDVNSVDRSHDGKVLATGDDFQKVSLFRYPCITKGAKCNKADGHASHIPAVRFTFDDAFLISTGGHDRAVIQWKHNNAGPA